MSGWKYLFWITSLKALVCAGREGMARKQREAILVLGWLSPFSLYSLPKPMTGCHLHGVCRPPPSVNILWECLSRQTKEVHLTSVLSGSALTVKSNHHSAEGQRASTYKWRCEECSKGSILICPFLNESLFS